jgi:hypothetical protein
MVNNVSRNGHFSLVLDLMIARQLLLQEFSMLFASIWTHQLINQPTILVLLDFSKAFDSVCHGLFNIHS